MDYGDICNILEQIMSIVYTCIRYASKRYWDSSQSLLPSKKMSHLPSQLALLSRFDDVFLFPFSEDMLARSLEGKYLNSLEKKTGPLESKDCLGDL